MKFEHCSRCSRPVPSYEITHVSSDGKSRGTACARCWAELLSKESGMPVGTVEIDPVRMTDVAGNPHTFHFRFDPAFRKIEAFELVDGAPGGYQFAVRPDEAQPEEPVVALLGRLLARIRRALAVRQIEPCSIIHGGYTLRGKSVRGRVDYDPQREHGPSLPVIVLDGRTFQWEEFGAMLMSFEGWDFRLSMLDATEEDEPPAAGPVNFLTGNG